MSLSPAQIEQLLKPIHPSRVFTVEGFSNLAAYDVRAHLTRIFGFANWSADLISLDLIHDMATETLSVNDPAGLQMATYTEAAVGESTMPDFKHGDAHDMAIKTAESQALKRCAVNLGDQFGLGLYVKGHDPRNPPAIVRGLIGEAAVDESHDIDSDPDVGEGYEESESA
jgi:hypothetical protein